jgi:hypothetical protein
VLPRPFRFEEFWTKDPSCGAVIEASWSFPVQGSPAYCMVKKLLNTKISLLKWNRIYFGNIQTKIKSTLARINQIQTSPPAPPLSLRRPTSSYLLMISSSKRRFSENQNQEKVGSHVLISIQSTSICPPLLEGDQMQSISSNPLMVFSFQIKLLLVVPLFLTSQIFSLPLALLLRKICLTCSPQSLLKMTTYCSAPFPLKLR